MLAPTSSLICDLPDLRATQILADRAAELLHAGDVVLLAGPLGAGKTEFARAVLRHLTGDPALDVPSPSYTLVQSYATDIGLVYHFDLWRLEGPQGIVELGWDEARQGVVLVEWPDRLGTLRPDEALTVELQLIGAQSRRAVLSGWLDRIGRMA